MSKNLESNIFQSPLTAYAELYVEDNLTSVSVPSGDFVNYVIPNGNLGPVKKVDLDETTQVATVLKSGVYHITCTYVSAAGTNNVELDTAIYRNEEKIPGAHIERQLQGPSLYSPASITTTVELTKGDEISLRIKHDQGTAVNITTRYASFSMHLIS